MSYKLGFNLILFLFISGFLFSQNGYDIKIRIKNYENDTLIVGNYFGERQIVKDTLYALKKGEFVFKSDKALEPGMYLILIKPDNNFIQFLINDKEQKFSIETDASDLSHVKFKGSKDNDAFYAYIEFLKSRREKSESLREAKSKAEEAEADISSIQAELDQLDNEVKAYQNKIIKEYKGYLISELILANRDFDIPEFEGTDEEKQRKRYYYYKDHYFDNLNPSSNFFLRSPFGFNKIDGYITKVVVQVPDSINAALDRVLALVEPNEETFRYYLSHYLNTYSRSKVIGSDAMAVHLIDNYYLKGKAPWVAEENLEKIEKNANDLRPLLIGKKFPNIKTFTEDQQLIELHKIKSEYTLLLFWANDCGHCKKAMPHFVSYFNKYKDKIDMSFVTVCTAVQDKVANCWEGVKEKNMGDFINTADEYARWRRDVVINSTPRIFVLNRDKEILIKDIPAEKIEEVMENIIRIEEDKKASK